MRLTLTPTPRMDLEATWTYSCLLTPDFRCKILLRLLFGCWIVWRVGGRKIYSGAGHASCTGWPLGYVFWHGGGQTVMSTSPFTPQKLPALSPIQ